jgi:hypothetical protein
VRSAICRSRLAWDWSSIADYFTKQWAKTNEIVELEFSGLTFCCGAYFSTVFASLHLNIVRSYCANCFFGVREDGFRGCGTFD